MHAVPARPSLITHSADFLRAALARGYASAVPRSELYWFNWKRKVSLDLLRTKSAAFY